LLSTDGGLSFPTLLADGIQGGARSFSWPIPPDLVQQSLRIRVIARSISGSPGFGDSNNDFATAALSPVITSVEPNVVGARPAPLMVTIHGRNFYQGAIGLIGAQRLSTKLISDTQLEATLPSELVSSPGTITIAVENPDSQRSQPTNLIVLDAGGAAGPVITGASISGKKLLVNGIGFGDGAKILLDGEVQKKTVNDEQNPTSVLIGNKAGKFIAPRQTVVLVVRNSDGSLSNAFNFTRPQ